MSDTTIKYTLKFQQDPNSGKPNRSWVKLIPMDETIQYKGREITFSEDYLRKLVSESVKLHAHFDRKAREGNGEPYRFPVRKNHKDAHDREGTLLQVKVADKEGFNGLWGEFEWTEETLLAIDADKVKHVSAGIVPEYQTEDGETFGPVVREVSLTSDPFLKGIGTIQDTLGIQLSNNAIVELQNLGESDMEELLAKLEEMSGKLEENAQMMQGVLGKLEAKDEEVEASQEEEEVEASQEAAEEVEEETTEEVEETSEEVEIEASQESSTDEDKLTLSAIKELIAPLNERLDNLEAGNGSKKNLNLSEKGKQGDHPTKPLDVSADSYDDLIDKIAEKHGVSGSEAIEMELNGTY